MRYFAEIAYKGTCFSGWQIQQNAISVQSELQKALSMLLKQPIEITGSGRTDAGVHAYSQIAHFDTKEAIDEQLLIHRMARYPLADIALKRIWAVKEDSHARFSAISRAYIFRIVFHKDPFLSEQAWFITKVPCSSLMNSAAQLLYGEHDFSSFCKEGSDTPHHLCKIHRAEWVKISDYELQFHVEANRFLRGMVRALVGSLLEVGFHKMSLDEFRKIFESLKKTTAPLAPPHGLYLSKVVYPDSIFLNI